MPHWLVIRLHASDLDKKSKIWSSPRFCSRVSDVQTSTRSNDRKQHIIINTQTPRPGEITSVQFSDLYIRALYFGCAASFWSVRTSPMVSIRSAVCPQTLKKTHLDFSGFFQITAQDFFSVCCILFRCFWMFSVICFNPVKSCRLTSWIKLSQSSRWKFLYVTFVVSSCLHARLLFFFLCPIFVVSFLKE